MVLSATLGHDTPPPLLGPGNEWAMVVIVYVSIFPQPCFICVHMPISGLSSLVQFLYMPATGRQPVR